MSTTISPAARRSSLFPVHLPCAQALHALQATACAESRWMPHPPCQALCKSPHVHERRHQALAAAVVQVSLLCPWPGMEYLCVTQPNILEVRVAGSQDRAPCVLLVCALFVRSSCVLLVCSPCVCSLCVLLMCASCTPYACSLRVLLVCAPCVLLVCSSCCAACHAGPANERAMPLAGVPLAGVPLAPLTPLARAPRGRPLQYAVPLAATTRRVY